MTSKGRNSPRWGRWSLEREAETETLMNDSRHDGSEPLFAHGPGHQKPARRIRQQYKCSSDNRWKWFTRRLLRNPDVWNQLQGCVFAWGRWWQKMTRSQSTFTLTWWQLTGPLIYLNICSLQVCFAVMQQASVLDSVGICLIFSWQDKAHKQPNIKHIKQLPANPQQRPNLMEEEVGWEQVWWGGRQKERMATEWVILESGWDAMWPGWLQPRDELQTNITKEC